MAMTDRRHPSVAQDADFCPLPRKPGLVLDYMGLDVKIGSQINGQSEAYDLAVKGLLKSQ
jgi:hypothetical protein